MVWSLHEALLLAPGDTLHAAVGVCIHSDDALRSPNRCTLSSIVLLISFAVFSLAFPGFSPYLQPSLPLLLGVLRTPLRPTLVDAWRVNPTQHNTSSLSPKGIKDFLGSYRGSHPGDSLSIAPWIGMVDRLGMSMMLDSGPDSKHIGGGKTEMGVSRRVYPSRRFADGERVQ